MTTDESTRQRSDRPLTPDELKQVRKLFGIHGRLHAALLRLIPDLLSLQPATARISTSPPYTDLHFDALEVIQHQGMKWLRFSLAHYYESNGDLVADPDMEACICLSPRWPFAEALNITQAGVGVYREVYPGPGLVAPKAKRELNAFLASWLRTAHQQGHRLGPGTDA
jgi:hypothetical protein